MPIPDFQSIMLPLLSSISDGKEHQIRDVIYSLADHFKLNEEERNRMQPSGNAKLYENRAHWARKHLLEAQLLDAPRRGVVVITDRGRDFLKTKPSEMSMKTLRQFPEYLEFTKGTKPEPEVKEDAHLEPEKLSPEDALEHAYLEINSLLARDLLNLVKRQGSAFFEQLVVDLLLKMGYGGSRSDAGQITKLSGDEGIDGTISEDKLGLDIIYVQAKKWDTPVGRPEIQKFVGALHGQRAKKGVFITTSLFTAEAIEYVLKIDPKVVLINGQRLAQLMIDHEVGLAPHRIYKVSRIDSDYFENL
jgi:restriction system protein